jgi:hypothetical protein
MSDVQTIRSVPTLDIEQRGGPVEVCEHVSLPSAYPDAGATGEYGVTVSIRCDVCEETYQFVINVN